VFAGFREASNESIEKVPISKVGHTIGFRFRRCTGKNLTSGGGEGCGSCSFSALADAVVSIDLLRSESTFYVMEFQSVMR
jgi:hypothetical protein